MIKRRLGGGGMSARSDGVRHATVDEAIAHGEEKTGSDDFNIGEIVDGRLARLLWMHRTVELDADELSALDAEVLPARGG